MRAAGAAASVTDTTEGAGLTVTVTLPLLVASNTDLAVIVVVPAANAVTWPVDDTVATAALDVVQVTAVEAPLTTCTLAVNKSCCPTVMVGLAGVTATDTTAGGAALTTTGTVADFVGSATEVAVTFAFPTATPLMTPVVLATDTMEVLDDDHVTAVEAPPTTLTVAVRVRFCPTTTAGAVGAMATEFTAGFGLTVTEAVPLFVASKVDVAVMVAVPTATA